MGPCRHPWEAARLRPEDRGRGESVLPLLGSWPSREREPLRRRGQRAKLIGETLVRHGREACADRPEPLLLQEHLHRRLGARQGDRRRRQLGLHRAVDANGGTVRVAGNIPTHLRRDGLGRRRRERSRRRWICRSCVCPRRLTLRVTAMVMTTTAVNATSIATPSEPIPRRCPTMEPRRRRGELGGQSRHRTHAHPYPRRRGHARAGAPRDHCGRSRARSTWPPPSARCPLAAGRACSPRAPEKSDA